MKADLCNLHEDTSSKAQSLVGVMFPERCFLISKKQCGNHLVKSGNTVMIAMKSV